MFAIVQEELGAWSSTTQYQELGHTASGASGYCCKFGASGRKGSGRLKNMAEGDLRFPQESHNINEYALTRASARVWEQSKLPR
jgi:hypothetical protein